MAKEVCLRECAMTRSTAVPLVLRAVAARVLAISPRTFERLEAEDVLAPAKPGKGSAPGWYDLEVVVPTYLAHLVARKAESARDRKDRSQAELNELKLARERRLLLPRKQVVDEGRAFIVATMAKLRALPTRMLRAGAIAPTAEPVVTELLRECQEEMARWNSALDLLAALEDDA
jgi:hypothetical protein